MNNECRTLESRLFGRVPGKTQPKSEKGKRLSKVVEIDEPEKLGSKKNVKQKWENDFSKSLKLPDFGKSGSRKKESP